MASTPDGEPEVKGAAEHFRRAMHHALDGLRCYAALLAADAQRRFAAAMRHALWTAALAVLALLGAILFSCGLAVFLDWVFGVPGFGLMSIGGLVLLAVLILAGVWRRKGRR